MLTGTWRLNESVERENGNRTEVRFRLVLGIGFWFPSEGL